MHTKSSSELFHRFFFAGFIFSVHRGIFYFDFFQQHKQAVFPGSHPLNRTNYARRHVEDNSMRRSQSFEFTLLPSFPFSTGK